MMNITEHDGNIYYIMPCINNCGIEWLTSDEIDIDGGVCSNCPPTDEEE